jgi:hypothetical protein
MEISPYTSADNSALKFGKLGGDKGLIDDCSK